MLKNNITKIWISALLVVLGYFVVQQTMFAKPTTENTLKVIYCDVGQGDATYIRTPENQDILIDGGPDDSVLTCLGKNMPMWDRELDLVTFSHDDSDHITGLVEVMRRYKVKQVAWSGITKDTTVFRALKAEIAKTDSLTPSAISNHQLTFGTSKPVTLDFIYPLEIPTGEITEPNNYSLIEKLTYGENSFLFTGDIMPEGTDLLVASTTSLKSDVLKVPHHGSKNGPNQKLLDYVKPEYATISVGLDNKYGHPHQEIIDLLMSNRIKIYRTDQDGQINFSSNGKDLTVSTSGQMPVSQ